jgi:glucokinase
LNQTFAIGLDLGGTKILGLLVDKKGEILKRHEIATPAGNAEALLQALGQVAAVLKDHCLDQYQAAPMGLGIGAPGPLNPQTGVIYTMPNLPGVENLPLAARLEDLSGLETRLENDANAALLGEVYFGAADHAQDAVMFTLGTGVGGAVFAGGKMIHGRRGSAGEFGHITVEFDPGRPCGCGRTGCLETVASGTAVSAIVRESDIDAQDSREFLSLLIRGDAAASRVLDRIITGLVRACSALINALNPELIVIGGGFGTALFEFIHDKLIEKLRYECFEIAYQELKIRPAKLGNLAGAMGAASLFLRQ